MNSTISSRGQTAVPAEIRRRFHLEPQSKLEWIAEGEMIIVVPIPKDPITAFRGSLKGRYSGEEFMKDRKADREIEKRKEGK